jgi:hypothetical protein
MRTELISIATDTLPLDGALYLPEAEPPGAVRLFHGNTMNFYVGAPRFLPPVLTASVLPVSPSTGVDTTSSASETVGLPTVPPSS